ncbi:MAG: cytochrome P450 [Acidimicrobiia bacterium]
MLTGRVDPYGFYADARRQAPLFYSHAVNAWVAVKHRHVREVLEDGERFRPLPAGPGSSAVHGRVILHMEDKEHRFHAGLLGKWIRSRRRLAGDLRALTERVTRSIMESIPYGDPVDLHASLNTDVPMIVTATFMGIPNVAAFRPWYVAIGQASVSNVRGDPEVQRRGQEARDSLAEWLQPEIDSRRERPRDDLLSDLATAEYDGNPLSNDQIASTCSLLLAAGVETTSRALTNLQRRLFFEPELWDQLRANRDLLLPACAEILRFAPPAHGLIRCATSDTELAGVDIGAGQRVMVLIGSANRDEDVFNDPERFVMARFADSAFRQFTPKADILPFGAGTHHCTGSLLAQMEMEVVMSQLLDRVGRADFVGEPPAEYGYVLRSPRELVVSLTPDLASAP